MYLFCFNKPHPLINITGTGCPGVFGGVVNGIPDSTHYLLTGLEEDTEYNVTLSTISEAAVGDPSHPVAGTTLIKGGCGHVCM